MAKRKKKATKKKAPAKAKGTNGKATGKRPSNGAGNGRHVDGKFQSGHDIGKDSRFQPGHPGGPGRPRGPDLVGIIAEILDEEIDVTVGLKKLKRKIGRVLEEKAVQHAMKGNAAYYKELHNRLMGKVPDVVHATVDGKLEVTDENLERLSTKELMALQALRKKMAGG